MFNLQGSELIIILLLALVVLGPEKLPDAMRRAGRMYADLKKMATGFQEELRSAIDEPMREMQETANLLRDSADFTKLVDGDRQEKPKSGEMQDMTDATDATDMTDASRLAPADPDQVPVADLPFAPTDGGPAGSEEFANLPDPDLPFAPTDGGPAGSEEFANLPDPDLPFAPTDGGPAGSEEFANLPDPDPAAPSEPET